MNTCEKHLKVAADALGQAALFAPDNVYHEWLVRRIGSIQRDVLDLKSTNAVKNLCGDATPIIAVDP